MKILFITSRFPYPPLKGDKIRAYYPIKLLSSRHEIHLLSFAEDTVADEYKQEMDKYCKRIEIIPISRFSYFLWLIVGIFTLWPSQVLCYQSQRMKKAMLMYLRDTNYDIVHMVCGRIAWYSQYIANIPIVIDWIDALSLSTERMYRTETRCIRRMGLYLEWRKMKIFELKNLKNFDFSFLTSLVDSSYLNNQPNAVIPNGVDANIFRIHGVEKDIDLIFTGNMSYYPNVKAVEFFCESVFPIILRKRPETTFYIVGVNPSKEVMQYHDGKNIFVTGYVDDIAHLLNRAKIFVAPLQSGAGIQNKILEALACGLPVVSSSYGNAGIKAKDGDEIIVACSPLSFTRAIMDLLEDPDIRLTLGCHGSELVKKKFSWESQIDILDAVYSKLITNKHRTYQFFGDAQHR